MDKDKITQWFYKHFTTHTDWTGTRVETQYECNSVKDIVDKFIYDFCDD